MSVLVKVCGITRVEDALAAVSSGADALGFNFWPKSKRYLAPERAPMLASIARSTGTAKLVGLFVNAEIEDIQAICARVDLDIVQLHGDESPDFVKRVSLAIYRPVWKALPIASARDLDHLDAWPAEALLLDAPTPGRGGAGARFDWQLARDARERYPKLNIVLAGG